MHVTISEKKASSPDHLLTACRGKGGFFTAEMEGWSLSGEVCMVFGRLATYVRHLMLIDVCISVYMRSTQIFSISVRKSIVQTILDLQQFDSSFSGI